MFAIEDNIEVVFNKIEEEQLILVYILMKKPKHTIILRSQHCSFVKSQ